MADEVRPSVSEQLVQEIVFAYKSAVVAGRPFDLIGALGQDKALTEKVCARLGLSAAVNLPGEPLTLSAVAITPRQTAKAAASEPATPNAAKKAPLTAQAPPAEFETLAAKLPDQAMRDQTLSLAPGALVARPVFGEFGDYELLDEIARGGMGIVFRAKEKSLNRVVALKMILAGRLATAEEVRRFRLEAEEASHLDHPGIVPIYHIGEHAGQHYFTMKFIEGGTLRYQDPGRKSDEARIAKLIASVAQAVHEAHRHGILHRDIKPSNILIDTDGRPHVTDFGLAKQLDRPSGQTRSGDIVGTPQYMSPEQAASRKDLTTATDIYSVGAVLYYLLTGRPPFDSRSTMETLLLVLEKDPVPPQKINPRLDRDLETICLTCLNKDPQRRYSSAAALAQDLERYLAGEPIHARRISRIMRARKWIRRRPMVAALAAVLSIGAMMLASGGWIFSARLHSAVLKAEDAQRWQNRASRRLIGNANN